MHNTLKALAAILLLFPAWANAAPALRAVGTIDLPGLPGERFDYLRVDEVGRRLFVTHLGAGQIYVVSLGDHKVATIRGAQGVEDVAYVPELNRLYTSNWGENRIGVADLDTMQVIDRIPTATKPDGMD